MLFAFKAFISFFNSSLFHLPHLLFEEQLLEIWFSGSKAAAGPGPVGISRGDPTQGCGGPMCRSLPPSKTGSAEMGYVRGVIEPSSQGWCKPRLLHLCLSLSALIPSCRHHLCLPLLNKRTFNRCVFFTIKIVAYFNKANSQYSLELKQMELRGYFCSLSGILLILFCAACTSLEHSSTKLSADFQGWSEHRIIEFSMGKFPALLFLLLALPARELPGHCPLCSPRACQEQPQHMHSQGGLALPCPICFSALLKHALLG